MKLPSIPGSASGRPTRQGGARGKPPTSIAAVAKLAGVSNATVSRVINARTGKVSEETRARVQAVVQKLNYRPSRAGSALRSGRSQVVALIIPDRFNSHIQAVAASLEKAVRDEGKVMVLCTTDESAAMQDEALSEMRSQLACGIILLAAVDSPGLREALRAKEPIVLVNRHFERVDAPYVGMDNRAAAAEVADAFVAAGHLRPIVFHGPLSSSATRERVAGFGDRLRATAPKGSRIRTVELGAFSKEEGYARARALLKRPNRPVAIFCTSDEIAYGVARACREAGVIPGRDLDIFGFDGSPINEYLAPWLRTVRIAYEEYGPAIVGLLRRYWDGAPPPRGEMVLVPYTLATAQHR
jgi:LacI family transcriptional regulator